MKRILITAIFLVALLLAGCDAPTPSATESKTTSATEHKAIKVDSNLTAANLKVGNVHGKDFIMEQTYMNTFVATAMLDDAYVDAKKTKSIVAIKPKPPFKPVFQVAASREESDIRILNEPLESSTWFLV